MTFASLGIGLLFMILLVGASSIIISTFQNGISPMPTSRKVKRRFLKTLPNEVNGIIFELGAGWGSLAFPLAKQYPACQVVAFENSWVPYLICKLRLLVSGLKNLRILRKDFNQVSLQGAALVVCYLYPGAMAKLKKKLLAEISDKALIVTHTFSIPGWIPVFVEIVDDLYSTHIYRYTIKQK